MLRCCFGFPSVFGIRVWKKRLPQCGYHASEFLAADILANYLFSMKFLLAILAYLLIAAVLGLGILEASKGKPWLLIVGFIGYVIAFGKIGCLPKKSH